MVFLDTFLLNLLIANGHFLNLYFSVVYISIAFDKKQSWKHSRFWNVIDKLYDMKLFQESIYQDLKHLEKLQDKKYSCLSFF